MLSYIRNARARLRLGGFVCALLALTALWISPPALGETSERLYSPWDWTDLISDVSIPRTLKRESADSYDYYVYTGISLPQGHMGGTFRDLDGDNQLEYVMVRSGEDNTVFLQIYERGDNYLWKLSAEKMLYQSSFITTIEAHDVFLKKIGNRYLIFCENWQRENAIADGASWSLTIFEYAARGTLSETSMHVEGTDITSSLSGWSSDPYYLSNYPELQTYAQTLQDYQLNIRLIYWNHMICEQDTSLQVLNRVYSGYDMHTEAISSFIKSNGNQLSGFYTRVINCGDYGYQLPEECYLSTLYDDKSIFSAELEEQQSRSEDEYVIVDSDTRLLTVEELSQYDKDTLALIRNEILARHGYPFQKRKYREYFEALPWYQRDENFTYSSLNSTEMQNVEVIKRLENQ
ncbi:MAG: YARHG domain-containing protein [Clostridia bacterium]|nr:YARHG domain-containing protein [Clostridia bacterium]